MTQEATSVNRSTLASALSAIKEVSGWERLKHMEQEQQRLESRLALCTAQKERTKAQIAAVKLAKKLLLRTLSSHGNKGTRGQPGGFPANL